jgi:predicted transcriptional regulator
VADVAGRPRNDSKGLPPLEAEVMEMVWATEGAVSVRQVLEAMNSRRPKPLAYTTVMTVMNRLAAKETLTRNDERRPYLYKASAPDSAGIAVRDVIRTHGDAAVAHFVEEARTDPDVLQRLRRLLEEEES